VRLVVGAVAFWTVVVAVVWLITPALGGAAPCEAEPGCEVLQQATNQFLWVTQQRPMVILSIGGYVAIGIAALGLRARR
jgi:hypothetical protein